MSAKNTWAFPELTKRLKEQSASIHFQTRGAYKTPEWGTVFLFDPEAREDLDGRIRTWYFPAVIEGLRGSSVRVHDEEGAFSCITDKRALVATREMIFLLEEPPRPLAGPDAPPWYVRGSIDCSLDGCMLGFDLILGLPLSVNLDSILELMKDDRMGGIPPTLSFERRISGAQEYSLSFSWGRGVPFEMERLITESVKKHVQIIEAVKQLERQWASRELFSYLSAKIIAMYGDEVG
ncbi:MAG: hypothetical protein MOB07_29725 [Acidobacteria bacterium]|nr:hypothetical protein [Acidobacteriota bacterium]